MTGAVIAAYICTIEAKHHGEDPDHVWNLLTLTLIFGIIGARLYHVFSTPAGNFVGWAYYREHPIDINAFWNGGFRGRGDALVPWPGASSRSPYTTRTSG